MRLHPFIFLCLAIFTSCGKKPSGEVVIGIQPFGSFSPSLVDTVKQAVREVYGFKTVTLQSQELPASAFVNIKSPRYRADLLLPYLKKTRPDSVDYVLGLTDRDISTTKKDAFGKLKKPESRYKDWGVCGLGYRPGPCAVVSVFRLKTNDRKRYMERFKKTCIHEIGHNLGLPHCESDVKCVMRDAAETVKTIDQVDLWLCDQCKRDLGIRGS